MTFRGTYAITLLFLGDILVFAAALWLTLFARYGELPTYGRILDHAGAFAFLFALWILVFYMAGLYGKRIILFTNAVFGIILRTQLLNIVLAALFFFVAPVGIAPKTNLIVYLLISLALILIWRLSVFPRLSRPASRERVALIGGGEECEELAKEVNGNTRYHLQFVVVASPDEMAQDVAGFAKRLAEANVTSIVIDSQHDRLRPVLAQLYELAFVAPGYQVLDFYDVYEEVFDRVPLSLLRYDWFLRNISETTTIYYPVAKRAIDIVGGILMGMLTIAATPFIALAMRIEGPGPVFIAQDRLGRYGRRIKVYKFRSMRFSDQGKWKGEGENKVTKVGAVLRRTSLDEFPQFVNVLKGEVSLIGPRNDILDLGLRLADAVPYYQLRYLVVPGITGWAQINQRYEPGNISPQSIEETKVRLAYDFYYIKHRSLALDVVIALKTVKRMLFRVSSW